MEDPYLKKLSKPPGAWRLRTGDWRSIFFRTGDDFLVAAIGLRKDIYERADRMRLARRGDGLTVIEAAATRSAVEGARSAAVSTQRSRRRPRVEQNQFSPFDDAMLQRIEGVDDDTLAFMRSMPATVDAPTVLAEHIEDIDLAFLLADLWQRPEHHLATFAAGAVPSIAGLDIEEAELRDRLTAASSATEVVEVSTSAQIRKLLDGSIEEWMVYLHPSQRAIANATFNGPAQHRHFLTVGDGQQSIYPAFAAVQTFQVLRQFAVRTRERPTMSTPIPRRLNPPKTSGCDPPARSPSH